MSSPVPKSSEGSKSPPPAVFSAAAALDSQQKNAPTAALAAIPSTVAISPSPQVSSQQAPRERTSDRRSSKLRHRHRKQSKAQSPAQRGVSSVSSFSQAVTPAYVLGFGTPQATTPDVWASTAATPLSLQNGACSPAASTVRAENKKGHFDQNVVSFPAQFKEATTADPSSAPDDVRPASWQSPNALKAAQSTLPARKRSVRHHVPSAAPDFLKALASLAPSPEEEAARKGSVKGSKSFLTVGEELPTSLDRTRGSYAPTRLKLSSEAKLALTLLLVLTTLAFGFLLYRSAKPQTMAYCKTKCCEEHRYRIAKQLVKGLDPCNNFGDYVCGRWLPKKQFHLSRSQMSDMLLSWLYNFPNRLNKGYARFPIAKKVVAMFNMCLRTSGAQIQIMKEFMRARGISWPEEAPEQVSPTKALFDLSFNWNVHLWFTLKVFSSVSKEKPRHIFFAPNELMLFWKATFSHIPEETFQRVYTELFKIFSNDTSSQPNAESIWETHRMLERVFNTLVPACPCQARIPKTFSFRDIDSNSALPIGSHMVNMLNAVTAIDPPITMDDLLLVGDMSQLQKILDIFISFSDEAVLRHLSWLFVQAYGPVAYPMAVLLVTHGTEHRARKELPRFCAGQVESSYKLLVAAMASASLFSEGERRRISDHLATIVQEAADKTWAVSWLDNDTKNVAVEKLKNVRTVLWPSDKFLRPEALEEAYANFTYSALSFAEYWIETRRSQRLMYGSEAAEEELLLADSTQLPYAEYEQTLNLLYLSLGALAPPLYCKDGTNAMLYGGLLYFYARMLITAIDSAGVKFNAQGDFVSSWLSDSIQETYEQRTLRCLPGNTSIFPEVPAMEVAYSAFKRHHKENNNRLSEELTEEKVFFITACLTTCATTPADNLYGGDCNKAVMNFAPFAEAFHCPVGSKMNPASKCSFYD